MHRPRVLTRRRALQGAALGIAAATGLSGCNTAQANSTAMLAHGATGGSLKDSLDPHFPVTIPDIARVRQLYEPLLRYDTQMKVQPGLAESIEHNADGTIWTIRLRQDVTFHNGKSVRATDVEASLERMLDPKNPAPFLSTVAPIANLKSSRVLDERTYQLHLTQPYAILDAMLASYPLGIIPADFDPRNPVGTGPFRADVFVPGQRSVFTRYDDYWDTRATFDALTIIDFTDDAAKVNALLAGQVQSIDNLPGYLSEAVDSQGATALVSQTGAWIPFTMRVDVQPFSDVRVRQAMRLIADRHQMVEQALNGFGRVANDLHSPFDPSYIGEQLPQREQDIDQAKALLRQAGQSDLRIELTTSTAVGAGGVESASLFVQQAAKAGVKVRLRVLDGSIFYGDQYLSWPFAQDFWETRLYLPQVAACGLKGSPYNETHWNDPQFIELVTTANRTMDARRRTMLLQDAQRIEHERGGYIVWAFKNQVDAYSNSVTGLQPARQLPVSDYRFNLVKPVQS
ncbi:peptide/nickel transport system substrate-binding protein [Luteococcus japonicus]|uniref:Peptide/nickel transport system substrate-binding protein n=1 Tax=Luteococcus japonicus TaxID=33984 RepID=A0A3N1ZYP0_9ACTN|nr:ABC transporter substrate-binding protein [Luteococcus japonicus]ROR55963.1 peptide/nickel transport system substrate-binding protein [Luteococcus japonicus]